jgi:pimeloyl-ACP methyl ester carboxylesterase
MLNILSTRGNAPGPINRNLAKQSAEVSSASDTSALANPSESVELSKPSAAAPKWPTLVAMQHDLQQGNFKNFFLGTALVAISKLGEGIEWFGRKTGFFDSFGVISQPMPPSALTDLPDFQLSKPLVLVPGWHTPDDRFDHLAEKLTHDGANGGQAYFMKNGQFYSDSKCTQTASTPGPEARVFISMFNNTSEVPNQTSPQLDHNIETIKQATGADKVDAVGYSMGGLASRTYLDQGGDGMSKLIMLGTPNQGSKLADASLGLLNLKRDGYAIEWLLDRKQLSEADRTALEWLRPNNPELVSLNSRWEQQRGQLDDAKAIGSASRWTLNEFGKPVHGNATVPGSSLALPGLDVSLCKNKEFGEHGLLFSNPEVYAGMADFFKWAPANSEVGHA